MNKISKFLKDPYYVFGRYLRSHFPRVMSDKYWLKVIWKEYMGYNLNLKSPQTFNEKLQWLKLYDRNPLYISLVDKVAVKQWLTSRIGNTYVIPTLAVYDSAKDIDFNKLPNKFVLKCNHDSGSTIICNNKAIFDINSTRRFFESALSNNYYSVAREWPYKHIKPKIIAEPLLADGGSLVDYKLMVFNGKVKCVFTCTHRNSKKGLKVTFFDISWGRLPFERGYPSDKDGIIKPISLNEMIRVAELICSSIPFARIDFYEIEGHPYVGEVTLYPGAGYEVFKPDSWDKILGDWLVLPKIDSYRRQ